MKKPKLGRPPKPTGALAAAINVRLSVESLAAIDARVLERQRENPGVTRADVVRELVHRALCDEAS